MYVTYIFYISISIFMNNFKEKQVMNGKESKVLWEGSLRENI